MTDNVVPLRTLANREAVKADSEKAAGARKTLSDAQRAKLLRQKIAEKPVIHGNNDRVRVATNLGSILARMETKGHKRSQLLRDLGRGKAEDSTKQLRTYVLADGATPESHAAHIRVLAKTAAKYVEIAEAAAVAMGEDTELVVLQLFEDTTYQVEDDTTDETIASMEQIRELLVAMAESAMRKNDLAGYLKILDGGKIGWDIDGSFGSYASLPVTTHFRDRAARHVSYLGCAPTVILYRSGVSPEEPVEGEAFQIDFAKDPDAIENFLFEGRPLPKKHCVNVRLSIHREIWFGLAPMQAGWSWKPVFEKRLSFRICGGDRRGGWIDLSSYDPTIVHSSEVGTDPHNRLVWLHQYTLLPRKRDGASLEFSVSPHIDTSESIGSDDIKREHMEDRWLVALNPFDSGRLSVDDDIEAGQFFYETVDLASCTKYLGVVADPEDGDQFELECSCIKLNDRLWFGDEETEGWYREFPVDGKPLSHAGPPRGSIARAIEQNLLRRDAENRLDTVLLETVAERVNEAFECQRKLERRRETHIAGLLDSWKSK